MITDEDNLLLKNQYKSETGDEYFAQTLAGFSCYKKEYVHWLEEKIVSMILQYRKED
jgi:hypothetical protein